MPSGQSCFLINSLWRKADYLTIAHGTILLILPAIIDPTESNNIKLILVRVKLKMVAEDKSQSEKLIT